MVHQRSQEAANAASGHIPVMLAEVLQTLAPHPRGVYVDGTFGAGGYTRAILEAAEDCVVYAIDRDPEAYARAQEMARQFPNRLIPQHGRFGDMADLLADAGVEKIDGIVLDIGVSSIQLSTAARGFSFQSDGPLDMRMGLDGESAADVVNHRDEKEIADIIFNYGEERAARRIAKRIVAARAISPITSTKQLVDIVHSVLPMHGGLKTDTATRTFQALRIFVNDELGELERALTSAEEILQEGGRLVVVTFHSLEDACVKNFLRDRSGRTSNASRHMPVMEEKAAAIFTLEESAGLKPTDAEISINPRSRSARLRYGIRTAEARHA